MTENQSDAYGLMYAALLRALAEIHNPGCSRTNGFDITGHIEEVLKIARLNAPQGLIPLKA